MRNIYPYSSPIIMTDDIYQTYGGDLAVGSSEQRTIAYWLAERAISRDISTFLLPTIVTGTSYYRVGQNAVMTEHAYVNSVSVVRFLDTKEYVYYSVTGTNNVHVSLLDGNYGLVDLHYIIGNCNCHGRGRPYPYHVQIIYEAGLPTGTANDPDILMALKTYSNIMMNEIVGYGNEAPGDIGVQSYRNQQYGESRVALLRTAYGNSAVSQFIHKLLTHYRQYRQVGL